MQMLRARGKRIFFVTNNSTRSRKSLLVKFSKLGLDVHANEIYSSAFAAASYFSDHPLEPHQKVYVIGQAGICEELDLAGDTAPLASPLENIPR